ncbi:MAG: response regulator [Telluria sp.]
MDQEKYPFSVSLFGFDAAEEAEIAAMFELAPALGPSYVVLHPHSLQDADLFVANGTVEALAALSAANPSPIQPALVIGEPQADVVAERLARPLDKRALLAILEKMVVERAHAMADLTARGLPIIPDRRRHQRPDFDLTDPDVYMALRKPPPVGAVLIVDKNVGLRDNVCRLLGPHQRPVEWTDSPVTALRLCEETPVALVLVNTSLPQLDAYKLCADIKALPHGRRICIVFLVNSNFGYDMDRARAVGVRGLLDKPVPDRHLSAVLKKLLSLPY